MQQANAECCPEFNVEKWDEKDFQWEGKKFIRDSVPALFHMPFPPMIGKKIAKMWKMAEESGKTPADKEEVLILFRDPSPFKSEMYLSVTGEVPGADNAAISGKFFAKVFDGPYNAIPKFIKEMEKYLAGRNEKAKDYYIHYAYCPKCAKNSGHNYMVIFAQI